MKSKAKKKKITIVELAGMTQRGFLEIAERMDKGFKDVKDVLGSAIKNLSENNTREHERMDLRLDNVAYRFELVELQRRVEILEKKTGIKAK